MAARLVRAGSERARLTLPEGPRWVVGVGEDALDCLPLAPVALEPDEVRVAVEAAGLNFWDVFAALRLIDDKLLGTEMCGRIVEVGSAVSSVARWRPRRRGASRRQGAFGPELVTHQELVARVPEHVSGSALATMPTVFLSAALSYEAAGLKNGDRVLVHAGAGGVGLAAIQLAQAAGAEVFATASAPKQPYLRALGVQHVFDSRSTAYGEEILDATGGEGVDIILNSLTAEGFIDASLSCLAEGGAFIELAARDILSEEEMRRRRPGRDLRHHQARRFETGSAGVARRPSEGVDGAGGNRRADPPLRTPAGRLRRPSPRSSSCATDATSARSCSRCRHSSMVRCARTAPTWSPGGLGGIGLAVADWLADHGARTIVLNGRRETRSRGRGGRGGAR